MAFVTDPDDLDRFQVALDPTDGYETISIRGLGTESVSKGTDGYTQDATSNFYDPNRKPFAIGMEGDILTIVSGVTGVIGHHPIASVVSSEEVTLTSFIADGYESGLTYRVNSATATAGPAGGNVGDGLSMQSLYSFLKEEWRTFDTGLFNSGEAPDLIKFVFPLESITREQFELGGATHSNWDFADDTTRNLIRTGGWAQINSSGVTETEYTGIITLGSLDSDAQVYYQNSADGYAIDFVLTGPVNQSIKTFDLNAGEDFRSFLKLFVRKKARSYAQSEIADIGVTTIETIVNRFPLTHTTDAAISKLDGELRDESPFQTVVTVDTGTDGVTTDPDTSDSLFTFTSAGSTFSADFLRPGDVLEITSATDLGTYEIYDVVTETELTLLQEPGVAIVGGSSLNFTTKTGIKVQELADGVIVDVDGSTGTLTSATATFVTDSVTSADYVTLFDGYIINFGVYKIISVDSENQLTLDTTDQIFPLTPGRSGIHFNVERPGMHLQFFSTSATITGENQITFADANPDTITRDVGDWINDGFTDGMAVTVTGATNSGNNGTFIVDSVTGATLTLIASETLTAEGPAAGVFVTGANGIVRTLNNVNYPFNWRLFGNGGSLSECFQFIQRELRRFTDIDEGPSFSIGELTDLLMTFASPTGVGLNMYIDDLAAADANNATFQDISGDSRNFAFIAGVTINLNSNLTDDTSAKVVVFFTDADAVAANGDEFGTVGAIIVQDVDSLDMSDTTPLANPLSFQFDYDNNAQSSRTPGTDAAVTIVAIGLDTAQYVSTTGTIQRQNNNIFSLVAALERNYDNPV